MICNEEDITDVAVSLDAALATSHCLVGDSTTIADYEILGALMRELDCNFLLSYTPTRELTSLWYIWDGSAKTVVKKWKYKIIFYWSFKGLSPLDAITKSILKHSQDQTVHEETANRCRIFMLWYFECCLTMLGSGSPGLLSATLWNRFFRFCNRFCKRCSVSRESLVWIRLQESRAVRGSDFAGYWISGRIVYGYHFFTFFSTFFSPFFSVQSKLYKKYLRKIK